MRTTVNFDDQLYARLKDEASRSGKSLRVVLNEVVSLGLLHIQQRQRREVNLPTFASGLRDGLSYDNISDLFERLDGPTA